MFGLAIHLLHKVVKDIIAQAQRMFLSVTVAPFMSRGTKATN
ncbi:hypothetical protein BRCON_0930 [Candidatus Sumerlaea chitinivorans]|uniref:Uncharacterized protein n=1 Tax=Sumerlaea chitinivorans TaxID=2250252 RepID=A0A2Z4Y3B8_SUMC1|nr:hypothetical protein BRCON_0930 [Candidatus Sumerlaea chitinivorans]